jgi:hypothetical protein
VRNRYNDLVASIKTWVDKISVNKLRIFNGGRACGPNGIACEPMILCPNDPQVQVKVMSANVGQQCVTGNKNVDSLVFKVTYGTTSIMFNGDFEDFTSSFTEVHAKYGCIVYLQRNCLKADSHEATRRNLTELFCCVASYRHIHTQKTRLY